MKIRHFIFIADLEQCSRQAEVVKLINEKRLRRDAARDGYFHVVPVPRLDRDVDTHPFGSWPQHSCSARLDVLQSGRFHQRVWNVLRLRNKTSISDLLNTVADDNERTARRSVLLYFRFLQDVGYIVKKGQTYFLVNNTGAIAPRINEKHRCVFDSNNAEWITWLG